MLKIFWVLVLTTVVGLASTSAVDAAPGSHTLKLRVESTDPACRFRMDISAHDSDFHGSRSKEVVGSGVLTLNGLADDFGVYASAGYPFGAPTDGCVDGSKLIARFFVDGALKARVVNSLDAPYVQISGGEQGGGCRATARVSCRLATTTSTSAASQTATAGATSAPGCRVLVSVDSARYGASSGEGSFAYKRGNPSASVSVPTDTGYSLGASMALAPGCAPGTELKGALKVGSFTAGTGIGTLENLSYFLNGTYQY